MKEVVRTCICCQFYLICYELKYAICNSEAAWSSYSLKTGLGWYISSKYSNTNVHATSTYSSVPSLLLAEALALRETLWAAQHSHLINIWMHSDSLKLIRAVNSKNYPMELLRVLMDIKFLSSSFDFILFSLCP